MKRMKSYGAISMRRKMMKMVMMRMRRKMLRKSRNNKKKCKKVNPLYIIRDPQKEA